MFFRRKKTTIPASYRPAGYLEHEGYVIAVLQRVELQDYAAFVMSGKGHRATMLTCGSEPTAEAAMDWAKLAIAAKPWIDGNPCPPDMYDRNPWQMDDLQDRMRRHG